MTPKSRLELAKAYVNREVLTGYDDIGLRKSVAWLIEEIEARDKRIEKLRDELKQHECPPSPHARCSHCEALAEDDRMKE